jgi:dihydropteroate synthase
MFWQTTRYQIDLLTPKVMGILNVTPDSFSDGGQLQTVRAVLVRAEQMLKNGAQILDVGGESTRPGSPAVPLEVELSRVLPVLPELVRLGVPISIDTYKPGVMQAALDLGVDIVNDIWALRQPGALQVVAAHPSCGVCLMHMHRDPQTMQIEAMTGDVLPEVIHFLQARCQALTESGVARERLMLDPGIGFGKTVAQNFSLLARQSEILALAYPLLAGWSRKSSLGRVMDVDANSWESTASEPADRVAASVAAALLAVERGASVVRVHDVKETAQALRVYEAMRAQSLV